MATEKKYHRKWSSEEDEQLLTERKMGTALNDISEMLNRSENAIHKRMNKIVGYMIKLGYSIENIMKATSLSEQEIVDAVQETKDDRKRAAEYKTAGIAGKVKTASPPPPPRTTVSDRLDAIEKSLKEIQDMLNKL